MKFKKRQVISTVLALATIVSSAGIAGYTVQSKNEDVSTSYVEYENNDLSLSVEKVDTYEEINNTVLATAPKSNTKSTKSSTNIWTKIINWFKSLFNKVQKPETPTTTKAPTTTKKTTTTSKKTTTTTKRVAGTVINNQSFLNDTAAAVNKARKAAGLSELKANTNLTKAATVRVKEVKSSFSHTRPDGRKSYTVYADLGITKPSSVAETIASATKFENASDIINVWLNSKDHRALILSSKYTQFGIAWYIADNGKEYAVMELSNG